MFHLSICTLMVILFSCSTSLDKLEMNMLF